jgi:DNA-binding transcriptional LysR family regulator
VSKTLAEIERMFGLGLFVRSTRGTEPTAYGKSVVRFARSVLADYGRTRDEIAAVASGGAGRTSIGAMVVATPGVVARAVELLKAQSSQTTVSIEEGDLTRLLPRLRTGELDLFVGRLEPGYAAPDLETEALYKETMCVIARPDHPLARKAKPTWQDLATLPWVVPPPWASSRIKLNQMFYKHRLNPPTDVIESASFLVTLTFVRQRSAIGFVAHSVARHLEREKLARTLQIKLVIDLPPVGIITMRGRMRTPATQQMIECLRRAANRDAEVPNRRQSGKRARNRSRAQSAGGSNVDRNGQHQASGGSQ